VSGAVSPGVRGPEGRLAYAGRVWVLSGIPMLVIALASIYGLWGAVISVGVTLVLFLVAAAVRDWERSRAWPLSWLLARGRAFEAYYREHPPQHPLIYLFYPLMVPFMLGKPHVRAELKLYRAFQGLALVIIVAAAGVEYAERWSPDLGFGDFLPYLGVRLAMEAYLTLSLLLPIATTVVELHQFPSMGRSIGCLLALAFGIAIGLGLHPNLPPSYSARIRVHARAQLQPEVSRASLVSAAAAARKNIAATDGVEAFDNGRVEGPPEQAAHSVLEGYWRPDEAKTFGVWASDPREPQLVVVFARRYGSTPPTWVGLQRSGAVVDDVSRLPTSAKRWLGLLDNTRRPPAQRR